MIIPKDRLPIHNEFTDRLNIAAKLFLNQNEERWRTDPLELMPLLRLVTFRESAANAFVYIAKLIRPKMHKNFSYFDYRENSEWMNNLIIKSTLATGVSVKESKRGLNAILRSDRND